jgi:hypothetical protein
MARYFLQAVIISLIVAGSCTGRKSEAERRNLIPEKDFISLLTDIYRTDGLLSIPKINHDYLVGDTLESYIDVIENKGYTKEQMDRTIRYYFVKKPKALIKIYDEVLGNLSEMESRINKAVPLSNKKGSNIWPSATSYISFRGFNEFEAIDIQFPTNGIFYLKFTLTLYPDDQSSGPSYGFFLSHTDTSGIESRHYLSNVPYIKDGHPHTYKIRLVQKLPDPQRIKGWFFNSECLSPLRESHYRIDNVVISRNPND